MESGLIDSFSAHAEEFDNKYDRDAGFRQRYAVWTSLLDRYSRGRSSAYDIGCGSGIFSFYLARKGVRVHGFDAAKGMIDLCERSKGETDVRNVTFSQLFVSPTNLLDFERVDLIVCSSVLEYIADLEGILRSMSVLLSSNGVIIASIPNGKSVNRRLGRLSFGLSGLPSYYAHVRQMITLGDLQTIASGAGLRILEYSYFADRKVVSRLAKTVLPPVYTNDFLLAVLKHRRWN